MAVIDDPQVNLYVNQQLRPACDRFISALRTLRQLAANYSAEGLGPLVAGTTPLQQSFIADGSTLLDGSKGDGRTQLLGYDVDNAITQFNAINTWINGQAGMEAALTKPSVNNVPIF